MSDGIVFICQCLCLCVNVVANIDVSNLLETYSLRKKLGLGRPTPGPWDNTCFCMWSVQPLACSNTCCVVPLWIGFPYLTGTGKTLDVKVGFLHSYHLSFAYFPTSLATDWSRTSFTAGRALVMSWWRQKDTVNTLFLCSTQLFCKPNWLFPRH